MRKTKRQDQGIEKMPTGVAGLDEITGGGLPRRRATLILGGPGCGKTVLALQTLVNGARDFGEPGIFVAFEENSQQIVQNAATFGWNLRELERRNLFFLDARIRPDVVQSGSFDLKAMLAALKAKAEGMGARRVVFDSVDVLLELMDDPARERLEIYRLYDWLLESGLSGIITSKAAAGSEPEPRRYDFLPFIADCVIQLSHRLADRISLRDLQVVKYRGTSFMENAAPFVISPTGMEVANLSTREAPVKAFTERVSSGVERLDTMLGGGYFRGAGILITGSPGTAKSTLAGAFTHAACTRGKRALYVSFDEHFNEIVRNLASVNFRLQPHLKSGLLRMHSARTESSSVEEHLLKLKLLIQEHNPSCMVVDPLSALVKAGGVSNAQGIAERLIHLAKSRGITVVFTSLPESNDPYSTSTEVQVSTVADTWIHLSYAVQAGERNRGLTIIKSRGMSHSNQVRELVLSGRGVTLTDVYSAGGEVLMGTLRWQKEQAELAEQQRERDELGRRRREIDTARSELRQRLEAVRREMAVQEAELEQLTASEAKQRAAQEGRAEELRDRRSADTRRRNEGERPRTGRKQSAKR